MKWVIMSMKWHSIVVRANSIIVFQSSLTRLQIDLHQLNIITLQHYLKMTLAVRTSLKVWPDLLGRAHWQHSQMQEMNLMLHTFLGPSFPLFPPLFSVPPDDSITLFPFSQHPQTITNPHSVIFLHHVLFALFLHSYCSPYSSMTQTHYYSPFLSD